MMDRSNLPLLVTLALGVFVPPRATSSPTRVPANMRATAVGLLSVFLIIGQIFGGSLVGGIVGPSISNIQANRALYLIFAGIALLATYATSLLAPRARERSLTSTA
jgi:MFS family permease